MKPDTPSLLAQSASRLSAQQSSERNLLRSRRSISLTPSRSLLGFRALSFRELNEQANRLAHFLREQGIGQGRIVGVLLDRSVEMVVCLLGILKSGGVYLPLDPKFPKDRLAFMLSDAEVPILLTQSTHVPDLPPTSAKVMVLEQLADELAQFSADNPVAVNCPEDTAYIIYTSGSTGNPKGVMVPRRALVNFLLSMAERPGMLASDTLLSVTTISFDISLLEMLLPAHRGRKNCAGRTPAECRPLRTEKAARRQWRNRHASHAHHLASFCWRAAGKESRT